MCMCTAFLTKGIDCMMPCSRRSVQALFASMKMKLFNTKCISITSRLSIYSATISIRKHFHYSCTIFMDKLKL